MQIKLKAAGANFPDFFSLFLEVRRTCRTFANFRKWGCVGVAVKSAMFAGSCQCAHVYRPSSSRIYMILSLPLGMVCGSRKRSDNSYRALQEGSENANFFAFRD